MIYNVLGVSCDVVNGKIECVDTSTAHADTKWQGEAMVVHYPYEAWGYMRSSEVYIDNMKEHFERVVGETQKCGEESADFLSDCGDFKGGVMLCEPTFYWSKEKNGVYHVVVIFQFLCENEDESTDEQCCTTLYMTEEVFNECIDIGSPNAQEM